MKAYGVTSKNCEVTEIVFAEKPSKAKAIAITGDWLCDTDYVELSCRRLPYFDDDSVTTQSMAPWDQNVQRKARGLGWYEVEGGDGCEECGLNEMTDVPESTLDENGVCGECRGVKL